MSLDLNEESMLVEPIMLSRSDTTVLPYDPIATSPSDGSEASSPSKRRTDQFDTFGARKSPKHSSLSSPSSPESSGSDSDDGHSMSSNGKKPGRKPMTDESPMEDEEDFKTKRRLQNRQAQRHFRERKERYVKELEAKLKHVQDVYTYTTQQVIQENHQLKALVYRLEMETATLKGLHLQQSLSERNPEEWSDLLKQQEDDKLTLSVTSTPSSSSAWLSAAMAATTSTPSQPSPDLLTSMPLFPSSAALGVSANGLTPLGSGACILPNKPTDVSSPASSAATVFTTNDMASAATLASKKSSSSHTSASKKKQQLQYTFSISTPTTLRARHKQQQQKNMAPRPCNDKKSTSPVELVRLYAHDDQIMTPSKPSISGQDQPQTLANPASPGASSVSTSSTSQATTPTVHTPTLECQQFCHRLNEEVCNNPFDQLLSEPLFDPSGSLNMNLGFPSLDQEHPLLLADDFHLSNEKHPLDQKDKVTPSYLPCLEIWQRLRSHHRFEDFPGDELLGLVKTFAKCSLNGPVLLERDIQFILQKMDQGPIY
ncbi:hypothetical protein DM01DRAFT_1043203 [Hesseltinella vesiculosa]|uniref:BZIP domain-containing protein n=1 Tax=Hesseltinella vesiculosa TaxID=101127 RepID=A0A1X2GHP5_9FUNG|nr:hypothetical protein DM01DRAFT_1043203 [Hesseltinella vesiculosa]